MTEYDVEPYGHYFKIFEKSLEETRIDGNT